MNISFLSDIWDYITNSTYSIYSENSAGDKKIWLEFDSIEECSFRGSSTVTRYPAEIGINITDYKYVNPDQAQIKGVITRNGTLGIGNLIHYTLYGKDKKSAIEQIRNECDKLVRTMQLVTIQTRNSGLRKNFTLSAYEIEETPDNYNLLEVDMTFDEVLLFGENGQLTREIADTDTQKCGIVQTLTTNIKNWWNNDTNNN